MLLLKTVSLLPPDSRHLLFFSPIGPHHVDVSSTQILRWVLGLSSPQPKMRPVPFDHLAKTTVRQPELSVTVVPELGMRLVGFWQLIYVPQAAPIAGRQTIVRSIEISTIVIKL